MMLPLEGLLVLDFAQFLAGPAAALRLADLGARVIKIERPDGGDGSRRLSLENLTFDGDSVIFHVVNRNKESATANLKERADLDKVRRLVAQADVLIQNFRPDVMRRLGLDYETLRALNPRLVYGSVSGYGDAGPWRNKPGQDLLAQSLSGLTWLSGNGDQPPVPVGLAIADLLASCHLAQGILACLVRRGITGEGGLVQISLLESMLDFQFEVLTAHLNDGGLLPNRSILNNAHPYLAAPYGLYATADGFLSIAMCPVPKLGALLELPSLLGYEDPDDAFALRDEIKAQIAARLLMDTTQHWLDILEPADIWCADVLTWTRLLAHPGFQVLDMVQTVARRGGESVLTTRCPIRIDGQVLKSPVGSPGLGEHNTTIWEE